MASRCGITAIQNSTPRLSLLEPRRARTTIFATTRCPSPLADRSFCPKPGEGGKPFYNGKNKSFFFFAYEPRWRQDFLTGNFLVPEAAQIAGNFNGLVRTTSGIVPQSVATQFGLTSLGATAATIYQQFVIFQGKLVPIALSAPISTASSTIRAGF